MSTTVPPEPELLTPTETSRRWIWMACIWSWPVCAVLFGISFVVVAGFLPPPLESASAADIATFYDANRTTIRAGLIGAMFASALLLPFFAVVSAEMRKIEGRNPLLAPIQYGGAIVLTTFFQIICLLWLLASLRPEINPEVIRAFNDYGWLVWTMLIPTYSIQFVCMAIAGFIDHRPNPIWPRWAAYLNIWVATIGAGGVLAVYLKTGPFSWNGIIGIWLPLAFFVIGMTSNMWLLHRRVTYEATLAATPIRASLAA
jgi:hypothetical protein